MREYIFIGRILPERAQLNLNTSLRFNSEHAQKESMATISIILNQLTVVVKSEDVWDIFTLRNVVKNIVSNDLAMIAYLKGYAYSVEITRVVNSSEDIDYVYGIDLPCIAEERAALDFEVALRELRKHCVGNSGFLLLRCFHDLSFAIQHDIDTSFYCYRAIETLRNHCGLTCGILKKIDQWTKLREICGVSEEEFLLLKEEADPLRHGNFPLTSSEEERVKIFRVAWKIVDGYLANISNHQKK